MEAFEVTDLEPIKINIGSSLDAPAEQKSTNFGDGIELLMNDKNKSSTSANVGLDDLNKLEDDLNELSSINLNSSNFTPKIEKPSNDVVHEVKLDEPPPLKVNFDLYDS